MLTRISVRSLFLLAAVALALSGCERASSSTGASASQATSHGAANAAEARLVRVDPSLVCMVNNQYMGRPQIPVTVGGATYYGCCEMCQSRLANDPASRTAVDPVSKKRVDKASAVIGRHRSGAVVYFESEANLEAFARENSGS